MGKSFSITERNEVMGKIHAYADACVAFVRKADKEPKNAETEYEAMKAALRDVGQVFAEES